MKFLLGFFYFRVNLILPMSFLKDYLKLVEIFQDESDLNQFRLCNYFSDLNDFDENENYSIAILGIEEEGNEVGLHKIRECFYGLYADEHFAKGKMLDLGNIVFGADQKNNYFALKEVVEFLIKKSIIPVIIGGKQENIVGVYQAYQHLEQMINLLTIDKRIDMLNNQTYAQNYLKDIILSRPNFLLNYTNVGHQTYFLDKTLKDLMETLNFDLLRLSEAKYSFEKVEPYIRNADVVALDLDAIKSSEFKSRKEESPNGFDTVDVCRLSRYAGISDKNALFFIGNYTYKTDRGEDAMLIAQMLWHYLDGFFNRKGDFPMGSKKGYIQYTVSLASLNEDLKFFKSPKSGRWWMEVPYALQKSKNYERHRWVPCSYDDYLEALKDEVPERWMHAYNKMH